MSETKPDKAKNGRLGLFLGIAISLAIISALVFALDWEKFAKELEKVNLVYVGLYVAIFLVTYWVRALRWRYLLPSGSEVSLRHLFDSFSVGLLATFILPFRAGEFIRAWSLQRWQGMPIGVVLASIVTERVFDVLTLLFLFALCLFKIENPPAEITSAAIVLGIGAIVILAVMVLSYFFATQMLGIAQASLRMVLKDKRPKLQETILSLVKDIIDGFRAISSAKELVLVLFLSLATWLLFAAMAQVGLWCFGEFPSFWVGLTTNSVVALAVAVPSAPGFIGTYQAGCWLGLSVIFGYPKELSIAYSVVVHAVQALVVFAIGLFSLQRNGLAIADLRKSSQKKQ